MVKSMPQIINSKGIQWGLSVEILWEIILSTGESRSHLLQLVILHHNERRLTFVDIREPQ
jgi:hypothetical protein